MTNSQPKLTKEQAIRILWGRGVLSYLFRPAQKLIYRTWLESKARTNKLVCIASRRLGKSTLAFSLCIEEALKAPGSNILFITPVLKNVERYVTEIAGKVLSDCPPHLRPELIPNKNIYLFPNGSQIFCVGSSNQSYENLRGTRVNLAVIDEAQKIEDLEILVDEVVMPSLFDSNGFLLMFGTIPRQPNHPFMRTYVKEAKKDGAFAKFDIYQAGYPPERIAFFRSKVSKEAFEREFECKENTSKKFNVTPNFKIASHMKSMPRNDYFPYLTSYTAMDIGGSLDQTHILFAYYDSVLKKLIVCSESVWAAQESRVDRIAEAVKRREPDMSKKILRVSDTNNFILMKELAEKHKLNFRPVQKGHGSLEAMIEILNIWIEADRIIVDPSCKILINELQFGSWNKTRTDLARSAGAHCDGILALAYMLTIVNEKGKLKTPTAQGDEQFVPPAKDPLDMKPRRKQAVALAVDEAFEYKSIVEDVWTKEI
jgi:hypothetical protein